LDCRLDNLHIGDDRQNHKEYRLTTNKTSKYIGVSLVKSSGKWQSKISINRKTIYLGTFINEIDAHKAYENALFNHLNNKHE